MYIDKKINEDLPNSLTDFLDKKHPNYNRIDVNSSSVTDISPLTKSISITAIPEENMLSDINYIIKRDIAKFDKTSINPNSFPTNDNIDRLKTTMITEFNNIYGNIEGKNLELEIVPDDSIVQQVKCRIEFNPSGQFNYYQYFKDKLNDKKLEDVKLLNIFFDLISSPDYIVNPSDYIGYVKLDTKTTQIMKSWDNIYKSLKLTDVSNFWYSIGLYDKRYSYKSELTNQLNEFIDQMFLKWFHQPGRLRDEDYQTEFNNFFINKDNIWSHSVTSLLLPTILNQYINTLDFLPYSSEDYVRVDHYCDSSIGRLRFKDITGIYEIPNDNSVLKNNTTTLSNWLTPLTHLEFSQGYESTGVFHFDDDYTYSSILIDASDKQHNSTTILLDEQFITEMVNYEHKTATSDEYYLTVKYDNDDIIIKTGTIEYNPYKLYNTCSKGPTVNNSLGDHTWTNKDAGYPYPTTINLVRPIYGWQYYNKLNGNYESTKQLSDVLIYTGCVQPDYYVDNKGNKTTAQFIAPGYRNGELLQKAKDKHDDKYLIAYVEKYDDGTIIEHRYDERDNHNNLIYGDKKAHVEDPNDVMCTSYTQLRCSKRITKKSDCGLADDQRNNVYTPCSSEAFKEIIIHLYNESVDVDAIDGPIFTNTLTSSDSRLTKYDNGNQTVILPNEVNTYDEAKSIIKQLKPLKLTYDQSYHNYYLYLGNGISNSTKLMLENDIRYWTQSDEPTKNYSALFSKVHAMNIFDDRYYYCLLQLYNQLSKVLLKQFEADLMTLITKYPEILVVYRFKQVYYNYITTIIESNDKLYWCSVQSFLSGIVLCADDTNLIPFRFYCTKPLKLNDSDVYDINDRKLVYSIETNNDNSVMDELYRQCQDNLSTFSNTMVFPAIQIKNNVDPNEFIATVSDNNVLSLVAVDVRDFNNIITINDKPETKTDDELTEDTTDKRTLIFALNDWYNITNINHTQFDELFSMSLPYVLIYKEETSDNIVGMYSTKLDNTVKVFISKNTKFSNLILNEGYTIESGNETFHQILFTGNDIETADIYNIIAGLTPIDDNDR